MWLERITKFDDNNRVDNCSSMIYACELYNYLPFTLLG